LPIRIHGKKVQLSKGSLLISDLFHRSGLYPIDKFPVIVGRESSGTIVGLPTDPHTLNDEAYRRRGYKIGAKVAVVCPYLQSRVICALTCSM